MRLCRVKLLEPCRGRDGKGLENCGKLRWVGKDFCLIVGNWDEWEKIFVFRLIGGKTEKVGKLILENLKNFTEEGKWENFGDEGYERILRRWYEIF